ncbi:hypothetical protein GCM10017744_007920 [Streptomyces antimycoticus]
MPVADAPARDTAAATRYTMTAFTNSSESNMYVYQSSDATTYTLLKGPAYTPPSGLIRDPSVIKHTDGYYYIVYTTNWTGNTIGFARSRDRLTWTFVRNHTLPVSGLERTWAPEFFLDDGGRVNIIVSLDTASTPASIFRPHLLTATDASLSSWTTPTPLRGLDTSNYIDTFVVRHAGQYHAFTKQETTKYIEHATANSLGGPYTFRGTATGRAGEDGARDRRWRAWTTAAGGSTSTATPSRSTSTATASTASGPGPRSGSCPGSPDSPATSPVLKETL